MPRRITEGPYWLTCGHCGVQFEGTWHQFKHWRYAGSQPFCSPICRNAAISDRFRKPKPQYGPCPTCKNMFESRVPKRFCSMKCYIASPEHAKAYKKACETARRNFLAKPLHDRYGRERRNCLQCGTVFDVQCSVSKKFCCTACYRLYMAARFDRWMASPQRIALPQAYDEFLASEELPCLVDGCEWVGKHLSGHMNLAHGVPADEFKRAAGFNLKSGIVSLPLHQTLVDRAVDYRSYGIAALAMIDREAALAAAKTRRYRSREGSEHHHKARIIAGAGPTRVCEGCGKEFGQLTPFGRAKFCSVDCRSRAYAKRLAEKSHAMRCAECARRFKGTSYQLNRQKAGGEVVCSTKCRGVRNIRFAQASRGVGQSVDGDDAASGR